MLTLGGAGGAGRGLRFPQARCGLLSLLQRKSLLGPDVGELVATQTSRGNVSPWAGGKRPAGRLTVALGELTGLFPSLLPRGEGEGGGAKASTTRF